MLPRHTEHTEVQHDKIVVVIPVTIGVPVSLRCRAWW